MLRPDQTSDFEALRSPNGHAAAVLVAYDLMEVDGHDVRPESLEERRTRLAKLLSRKNNPIGDGIQLSEAITGDGDAIFRHACYMGLEGIVSKRIGSRYVSGRTRVWLKTKNPGFRIGVDASQARTAAVAPGFLANIRGEQSGTSD